MSEPEPEPAIGNPGEDVLALAFAGGAFDTVMQLGVVHALLVSGGRPPHVVAGISAGAVNAVALADVFQAGEGLDPDDRLAARVARLREVLESFQQSPELIYNCLLPDPYEVEAHSPLEPVKLPIHHQKERKFREDLSRERAGLIALINDLLAIRLPVRIIAQVTRRILGIAEAGSRKHWWQRKGALLVQSIGLWWIGLWHLGQIAPLVGIFLRAWRTTVLRSLPWVWALLSRWRKETTAGSIILRSPFWRAIRRASGGLLDLVITALIWLVCAPCILVILILLSVFGIGRRVSKALLQPVPEVLLRRYSLVDSLASPHPLRQMFVRLFDPVGYYGPIDLRKMLEAALRHSKATERDAKEEKKTLSAFFDRGRGIFVAPVAADIEKCELTVLPQDESVVDALLAAMAVVPLFPAQQLGSAHYIDGINVANEPTAVLVELLRQKIHPQARRAKVFAVSPLPVSSSSLPDSGSQYQGLIPVVQRVLALKRFRDALMERRLTQLHTCIADEYVKRTPTAPDTALQQFGSTSVMRADVFSIEPDRPLDLNTRLLNAETTEERRGMVLEAVAKGCRAALETMLRDSIVGPVLPGSASCWRAVGSHLGQDTGLPGSQRVYGPGLAEVCQSCALNRDELPQRPSLRVLEAWRCSPWPREGDKVPTAKETVRPCETPPPQKACEPQLPQVALLFSGGVFRGVFQVGAITALSELGAQPRIFAGASVGSIMAAMATRVFASAERTERNERIALLASTFLTLDRLVLTDRFADFVRRFTLRAGAADFSVADVDRFLRRYDTGSPESLGGSARKVLAGFERLFYLTPFEVVKLVRSLRMAETASVTRQLSEVVQYFLDRFEVGQEILGAEPLSFLITQLVLKSGDPRETFADLTREREVTLLAVATNLTQGLLEILPNLETPLAGQEGSLTSADHAVLLQSLLASSAFPAVFRPRWSWEVFPRSSDVCQYVDGGVMDNLPLDAVVQYLKHRVESGDVAARPVRDGRPAPHLLFAASLEPKLRHPRDAEAIARNWPALLARARQLGYNRKIDGFRKAQERFRTIWNAIEPQPGAHEWQPLDIEVVTAKPEWLCHTFGFHPMLGFRRRKQAQSIAHGCAMTLGTLYAVEQKHPDWFVAWKLDSLSGKSKNAIRKEAVTSRPSPRSGEEDIRLYPQRKGRTPGEGQCWFRSGVKCPFAATKLPGLKAINAELDKIYQLCGEDSTHRPA